MIYNRYMNSTYMGQTVEEVATQVKGSLYLLYEDCDRPLEDRHADI